MTGTFKDVSWLYSRYFCGRLFPFKVTPRNFHSVLILAPPVDKGGSASTNQGWL